MKIRCPRSFLEVCQHGKFFGRGSTPGFIFVSPQKLAQAFAHWRGLVIIGKPKNKGSTNSFVIFSDLNKTSSLSSEPQRKRLAHQCNTHFTLFVLGIVDTWAFLSHFLGLEVSFFLKVDCLFFRSLWPALWMEVSSVEHMVSVPQVSCEASHGGRNQKQRIPDL